MTELLAEPRVRLSTFVRHERDKERHRRYRAQARAEALQAGNDRIWRCRRCGGWRYLMRAHTCARNTGAELGG